jgi:hypothetical protein
VHIVQSYNPFANDCKAFGTSDNCAAFALAFDDDVFLSVARSFCASNPPLPLPPPREEVTDCESEATDTDPARRTPFPVPEENESTEARSFCRLFDSPKELVGSKLASDWMLWPAASTCRRKICCLGCPSSGSQQNTPSDFAHLTKVEILPISCLEDKQRENKKCHVID